MDLGLTGKVAVVAGGSSGLGLAVATELAAEGAHVDIGARDADRMDEALARIATGPAAGTVTGTPGVDVRDDESVRAWIDGVAQANGGLHVVVANGGGPPAGTATAHDLDAYRDAVELSLLSQVRIVQAALGHLRDAGWGRILFVTSQSVRQPMENLALSNVARPGVVGYAKSLVADLAGSQITVNVLAPGTHLTPRIEELAGDDLDGSLAAMAEAIPLGRIGDPAEFGAAAAFLASERASFITGAVLPVDGGSSRGFL